MTDIIISIGSIAMIFLVVIYFYLFEQLKDMMKVKYPRDYKHIGEPTLFLNSSMSNHLALHKYLSSKSYEKHRDEEFNSLCYWVFILLRFSQVFFIGIMLLFVVDALNLLI